MSYVIKVQNKEGGEKLLQVDPTKVKVMQVVPGYKATSSPVNLERSEKSLNNISILPSSLPENVIRTQPSTSPMLVMSEPTTSTIQDATKESWTDAEIQLLLEQRLSMNDKFENPNSRKTPYWNLIVQVFEEKGYKVTKDDLVNKWKNLQVTYNRNVSKLKRTGESAITWKYFHQMHEVFAEKKSVNPPKESLGSTFKPETLTLKDDSAGTYQEETQVDIQENILPTKKRRTLKKEKIQFQEEILRLVEEKKSQSLQLKKEIWEDKKKIATDKIEAINNLVTVLKDLQQNRTT
ncbi:trihelix transcription factor GTL2 isoform X2 [Temnothorax curvispinosus]|uniref:Trihelix transcription factor GTL2 isoform X2 n=1 Tax=Temnothorax curvispinosus TaxID=300111 RepID=A0A6J1RAY0_9HYME|nr:trihelix transcription factor GTL2 isoform X2 [Temnothorax curvispinosus]